MKKRKIPLRKCVACQEMKPKKDLLRVVRTPEQEIDVDPTGKKSGRGAYICYSKDCLELSKKRKSLDRALDIAVSPEVYESIKGELPRDDESR